MGGSETAPVDGDDLVDSIMRLWPGAIRVFLDHHMRCVGCPVGRLHTVAEACREHEVDLAAFLTDLSAAVRAAQPRSSDDDP
jgi:hybrid cluster-associated redox disulfide protein